MIKLNNFVSLILHYFNRSNNLFQKVKSDQFQLKIQYKSGNERFTNADWVLQKMFEIYVNKYFPELPIIGEEDTTTNLVQNSEYFSVNTELDLDLIKPHQIQEDLQKIKIDELCLFIDPIDSTDQFIQKNFNPVTSIVGLTYKNKPLIGFIYHPIYLGSTTNSLVFFNLPKKGIFSYNTLSGEIETIHIKKDLNRWVFISGGWGTKEEMKRLYSLFGENSYYINAYGLGNKALQCVLHDFFYISDSRKLGFWDVCGGHALAKEVGGGLYYIDGTEVIYPRSIDNKKTLGEFVLLTNDSERVQPFLRTFKANNIHINEDS